MKLKSINVTELPKDQYGMRAFTDDKPRVLKVEKVDGGYKVLEPEDVRTKVANPSWLNGVIPSYGGLIEVDQSVGDLTEDQYVGLLESLGRDKVPDYDWTISAARHRARSVAIASSTS